MTTYETSALGACRVAAARAREWQDIKALPTMSRHMAGLRQFGAAYASWLSSKCTGVRRTRDNELFWGDTLRVDLDDYDGKVLYLTGTLFDAETPLSAWFIRTVGSHDVVYD